MPFSTRIRPKPIECHAGVRLLLRPVRSSIAKCIQLANGADVHRRIFDAGVPVGLRPRQSRRGECSGWRCSPGRSPGRKTDISASARSRTSGPIPRSPNISDLCFSDRLEPGEHQPFQLCTPTSRRTATMTHPLSSAPKSYDESCSRLSDPPQRSSRRA